MNWEAKTIETYDQSAVALAEYFSQYSRVNDIERAIELLDEEPGVELSAVEIGCGDGRDAAEIVKRFDWYEGFDPSEGMLDIARGKVPNTSFVKADALTYDYPIDTDVIFAFASLLHVSVYGLKHVFSKAEESLQPGGIIYMSLKESSKYEERIKKDRYGERRFYYYSPSLVKRIAGQAFDSVYEDHQTIAGSDWFTLALKTS